MGKVYLHKPRAVDEKLGRVDPNTGKVYRRRVGPDQRAGRVELSNGKIYRNRVGPDEYVGRVNLDNGKIYRHRVGPDEYVGRVKSNGRIYLRDILAPDDYVGRVDDMDSLAEGGAAFFLLVLPAMELSGMGPDDVKTGKGQSDANESGEGE